MQYTDSHCHLHLLKLEQFGKDLSQIISLTREAGVGSILCPAVSFADRDEIIALAESFADIYASVGLHPSEKVEQEPTVEDIVKKANHPKVIAIGETGLDYYYNDSGLANMRERFRTHVQASRVTGKPVIVHSRDAQEDTMTILREENATEVGGVMHCFTESWEMAQQALELGLYISFSGIVTFKNGANVAEVARQVPLEFMLIETDAPYLTPVPFRGKPNGPQYVPYVAQKIAELKQIDVETVAYETTQNFKRLFKLVDDKEC